MLTYITLKHNKIVGFQAPPNRRPFGPSARSIFNTNIKTRTCSRSDKNFKPILALLVPIFQVNNIYDAQMKQTFCPKPSPLPQLQTNFMVKFGWSHYNTITCYLVSKRRRHLRPLPTMWLFPLDICWAASCVYCYFTSIPHSNRGKCPRSIFIIFTAIKFIWALLMAISG